MEFKDLLADHDYYCCDEVWNDRAGSQSFTTWTEFMTDWVGDGLDMDYNLLFRWDINLLDDDKPKLGYRVNLFFMQQRKGKFTPIRILRVFEEDFDSIHEFLAPYWDKMKSLWAPLSGDQ